MEFDQFYKRYKPIYAAITKTKIKIQRNDDVIEDMREVCEEVMKFFMTKHMELSDMWQIGLSKVFLKEETRTSLD